MGGTLTIDTIRLASAKMGPVVPALRFIESEHLTVMVEDWSEVRSPSRAARRRKQGHPQRIKFRVVPDPKFYQVGDMITAHPATMRKLRDTMAARVNSQIESTVFGTFYGDAP